MGYDDGKERESELESDARFVALFAIFPPFP